MVALEDDTWVGTSLVQWTTQMESRVKRKDKNRVKQTWISALSKHLTVIYKGVTSTFLEYMFISYRDSTCTLRIPRCSNYSIKHIKLDNCIKDIKLDSTVLWGCKECHTTKVLGFILEKISVPTEMDEFREISVQFRTQFGEISRFETHNLFRT